MQSSGTVGQTQVNVATLVDTAFRRCGKNPSTVSGEQLEAALNALFFLLTDLMNDGVNLFCVRKNVLNVVPHSAMYPLPAGTDDVLNVLYRTLTSHPGIATSGPASVGWNFTAPVLVQNVSGVFGATGPTRLVIEYFDGSDWVEISSFAAMTVQKGADFSTDLLRPVEAMNWRVRDLSGNDNTPADVRFRTVCNELNMSKLNRDDYVNLPNKTYGGQKALQYWYDKQVNPAIYVWPVSNRAEDQIVVYQHGQVEDIGKLTNSLAVPARWYEFVVFALAERLCLEIAPQELPPGRLEYCTLKAAEHRARAGRGESDGSPMRLAPRIGGYTR